MLDLPALTQIIGNGEAPVRCTKCNCTYTITKFQQFLVISFLNEHSFWQYLGLHRMRFVVNKRSTLHTHTITESHASNLSSARVSGNGSESDLWHGAVLQHQQLALGNTQTRTVWCWRPTREFCCKTLATFFSYSNASVHKTQICEQTGKIERILSRGKSRRPKQNYPSNMCRKK